MVVADVAKSFREKSLFRLQAEKNRPLANAVAGAPRQKRRFDFAAFLPVFVHAVQPIGKPGATDLQKRQAQFWKSLGNALKNHVGELNEDSDRERYHVNFSERLEGARGKLVAAVGTVHGDGAIQTLCFAIDWIIESVSQRQAQPRCAHDGGAITQLLYRAPQFHRGPLRILGRDDGDRPEAL